MGVARPERAPGPSAERRGLFLGATDGGFVVGGPEQGALVLGPPRSGKTSAIVIPNVLGAPGAVVSTSTKPDVLQATVGARSRAGRCWLFDPTGTVARPPGVEPLRWSPVTGAGRWDGAVLMAKAMVRAARPDHGAPDVSHWTERAEALLAPLLHAAALGGLDAATLMGWVNRRQGAPAVEILADEAATTAGDLLLGLLATEERELSGIWSTASGVLAAYRMDATLAGTAQPNFDPAAFVEGRDTVYVCATGRQQAMVAPLVVGLLEDVREAAYQRAAAAINAGSTPYPTVLLALDEVANVAPLPDLPDIVSEGGGQGLVMLACLQDLSQARARWGQEADGFGSLFGAIVVFRGINDVHTLQALSARCGEMDVPLRSESRGRSARSGSSRSVTWTTRRQPRLSVDEIAEGHAGCALVIGGADPARWVGLAPWWSVEPWRTLARGRPHLERPLGRAR